MAFQIKIRRDSAADWISANSTLGAGEFGLETDTEKLKIGDGSTAWNDLQYITGDDATALFSYQGSSTAYFAGGYQFPAQMSVISSYPLASSGGGTDYGDLTQEKWYLAGTSSADNGYTMGGEAPPETRVNVIEKFPFATSTGSGSDVGDLTNSTYNGNGFTSGTHGYHAGGGAWYSGVTQINVVDKFPFASDTNATDAFDLTRAAAVALANQNLTYAYSSGGILPGSPNGVTEISRFAFASDVNATDIGDLTVAMFNSTGAATSSSTVAYQYGGNPSDLDAVYKFPFATETSAQASPGTFTASPNTPIQRPMHGNSGSDASYISGRNPAPSGPANMWKIPYASEHTGTEWTSFTFPEGHSTERATSNIQV